jgi:hypothetical protein
VAVASPAAASRRVAAELIGIIYARHPLFAGTKTLYRPGQEPLHGGDLLLAARGVIAAGCLPPGVARLAGHAFDAGLACTVLAGPARSPGPAARHDLHHAGRRHGADAPGGARPGRDARTERGYPGQAGTMRNRERHRAGQ